MVAGRYLEPSSPPGRFQDDKRSYGQHVRLLAVPERGREYPILFGIGLRIQRPAHRPNDKRADQKENGGHPGCTNAGNKSEGGGGGMSGWRSAFRRSAFGRSVGRLGCR